MTLLETKMLVEKARERMNKAINRYGLESVQALRTSKILDKELNHYEAVRSSFKW